MIPGEYILSKDPIEANEGKKTITLVVHNTGDRPIQVGSHFHFFEVNRALVFERSKAFGMRLNIPAGTAVRFEPGQDREIHLIPVGGERKLFGLNGLTNGKLTTRTAADAALKRAGKRGFGGA